MNIPKYFLPKYPSFYENSPEFQEILYVLECEMIILWYAYKLFCEYVVMNGVNPTVICKHKILPIDTITGR